MSLASLVSLSMWSKATRARMIARKKMCDVCDFIALSVKERIAVADLRSELHVDV